MEKTPICVRLPPLKCFSRRRASFEKSHSRGMICGSSMSKRRDSATSQTTFSGALGGSTRSGASG